GIVVDRRARTSEPAIFAAGDCTRFPAPHGPVRLESLRHAQEHGAIAGRNAAGGDAAYDVVPSFWSEQHEMYIQGVGWPLARPTAYVRRSLDAGAVLLFELDGPRLAYVWGVHGQREAAVARRGVRRPVPGCGGEVGGARDGLGALPRA